MDSIRSAIGRRSGVWENPDFLRFWTGETIANFGGQLGLIALPLIAAITLGASPFQMGLLAACSNFPRMVVGIFAGAWVDRRKRRPIMIGLNLTRAVTVMAVPIAAAFDALTFSILLAIAILLGMQSILFDSAWSAMVPTLVERRFLADANGKLWASMSLAQITGPAIAGTLIAWFTGPNVMIVTALTLLASAWFMAQIQRPEPEPDDTDARGWRTMLHNISEGYGELVRNRIVRPLTTTMVGIGFGAGVFNAVYILFLTDGLNLSSRGVGLVYAISGVGALIGSMVAAPLAARFGYGPVIMWGAIVQSIMNLAIPLAFFTGPLELVLVVLAGVGAWIFFQAYDINRFSLRQAVTRPNLMGRVASSTMTLLAAAGMLGSLIGGTVGEVFGIRAAMGLAAVLMIASTVWTVRSPIPGIREMPESLESIPT